MKTNLFLILCLLASCSLCSQTIEYYDADWKRLSSEESASFYREIDYDRNGQPIGIVKDYYITGELQFVGELVTVNPDTLNGLCIWYYQNGQRRKEASYQKGVLISSVRNWSVEGKEEGVLDESGFFFSADYRDAELVALSQEVRQSLSAESTSIKILFLEGFKRIEGGNFEDGLRLFRLVHDFSKIAQNDRYIAISYNNIGGVYDSQGKYAKALVWYNMAEPILKRLGFEAELAILFNNKGVIYRALGNYPEALNWYAKAKNIQSKLDLESDLARSYNNIGMLNRFQGNFTEALDWFDKAKSIQEKLEPKNELANSYHNIAAVYRELGEYDQAMIWFTKSREIRERLGLEVDLVVTYNNIGELSFFQGDHDRALGWFNKALEIGIRLGLEIDLAISCKNIGELYRLQGSDEKALYWLSNAHEIQTRLGLELDLLITKNNIGLIYQSVDSHAEALEWFDQAKEIGERLGLKVELGTLYGNIARTFYDSSLLDSALIYAQTSIHLNERTRQLNKGQIHRWLFVNKNLNVAEIAVNAAIQVDKPALAFEVAEGLRSRSLSDLLSEKTMSISSLPAGISEDKRLVKRELSSVNLQLAQQIPVERRRELILIRDSLYRRHLAIEDRIRLLAPEFADLSYPEPVSINQTQNVLADDEILIEYYLGAVQSYAFCVTKDSFKTVPLFGVSAIGTLIQEFKSQYLTKQKKAIVRGDKLQEDLLNTEFAFFANSLHKLLWEPLKLREFTSNKRVLLVPDGTLHYLPFELLIPKKEKQDFQNYNYLIRDYEISYYPSATVFHLERKNERKPVVAAQEFLGVGVADFSNNNCYEESREIFHPLPHSTSELKTIAKNYIDQDSRILVDLEASEENFKRENLENYKRLHFSTHSVVNAENPAFSRILLHPSDEEDGCLNLYEFFELEFNADLITFSACGTGLGKLLKGEGMMGFTRALMYAGTPSVILSLWEVADESTNQLYIDYYSRLTKDGSDKYAPLRAAQLKMIDSGEYSNPYYWAPFVFIGGRESKF